MNYEHRKIIKNKGNKHYRRIGVYSLNEVLPYLWSPTGNNPRERVYQGHSVKMNSVRLSVFAEKGITCVCCGLKGIFFALEQEAKAENKKRFHFNLYGIDGQGNEVMLTKDHIKPRSCVGDRLGFKNYQTMCSRCNNKKADKKWYKNKGSYKKVGDRMRRMTGMNENGYFIKVISGVIKAKFELAYKEREFWDF